MKLYTNPNVFFLMQDGNTIAWDYKNRNQFEIEKDYFERLLFLNPSQTVSPLTTIDEELLTGGLIDEKPFETSAWGDGIHSPSFITSERKGCQQ